MSYFKYKSVIGVTFLTLMSISVSFYLFSQSPDDKNYLALASACTDPDGDGYGNPSTDLSECSGSTSVADNCPSVYNIAQTNTGALVLPDELDNLELWLKADAIEGLTDGQTVTSWNDESGSGNSLTVVGSDPSYETNELNGLPVVRFDTNDYLRNAKNHDSPTTIISVARQTGGTNARVIGAASNNWLMGFYGGSHAESFFNGWVDLDGPPSDTNWYIHSATIPGAGNNSTVYENGTEYASNQGGTAGPNGFQLNGSGIYGEYSNAEVAEVIIYNDVLTIDELQNIQLYLAGKYDLTVSHGSPAGDSVGDACDFCWYNGNDSQADTNANCPSTPFEFNPQCGDACDSCGNGSIDIYEQCDDGNLTNGDGCNSSCRLTKNDYRYKHSITIDADEVDDDVVGFPVLLIDDNFDDDVYERASSNASDLFFTADALGLIALPFEVVSWDNATKTSEVWVRVSDLSSTVDTTIYVWYGSNAATNLNYSSKRVWSSENNYVAVYHLDETVTDETTGSTHYNSTPNDHDGTHNNNTNATGKIKNGQVFDGTNDSITVPDSSDFNLSDYTFSVWIKTTDTVGDIVHHANAGSPFTGFGINVGENGGGSVGKFCWWTSGTLGSGWHCTTETINDNTWHMLTATFIGGTATFYIDGVSVLSTTKFSMGDSTNILRFGRIETGARDLNGILDEISISNAGRSAGWVSTSYNNQNSPSTFSTPGAPELASGDGLATDTSVSNNSPNFSATPSDDGSANPLINVGDSITFTATAKDPNTDQYYLAICKTDAVTAVNNLPPTCDGGAWAISSATSTGAVASVSYTILSGDTDEINNWFAFACDLSSSSTCYPTSVSPHVGDQGFAVGTIDFSSVPADASDIVIDGVIYEFDRTDGSSCSGGVSEDICLNISSARAEGNVADSLVTAETGSSTHLVARGGTVYVYANTKGVAGNSIEMSFSTCAVCTLNGGTEGVGTTTSLVGGDDDDASPFYINHAGTFTDIYIGDTTDEATGIYPDSSGLRLTAGAVGVLGNALNLSITNNESIDCVAETAASLAALIVGSSPDFTLTCDLDDSTQGSGSNPLTGALLAAAINDGTTTTIDNVLSASVLNAGSSAITAGTITLTNVNPGDTLTFLLPVANITENDTVGGQDTVQMHVCPSGNVAFDYDNNECDGATAPICSSSAVNPTTTDLTCTESAANLVPVETEDGTYDVEIYIEDNHSLPATGTSTQSYEVVTIGSVPTLLAYTAVDEPTPPAGGSDTVTFSVTIEDNDGESDVTNVKGVFFDPSSTGVGNGGEGTADCVANEQNCYIDSSCTLNTAYGDSNQLQADCSVDVWFNANASDWDVQVEVTDSSGVTEFADASVALTNLTLSAINVPDVTISYGALVFNETSTEQSITIQNVGNLANTDVLISGTDMTYSSSTIPLAQQRWSETTSFAYAAGNTLVETPATTSATTGCFNSNLIVRADRTSTANDDIIYWLLKIPAPPLAAGSYSGSVTILSGLCDE